MVPRKLLCLMISFTINGVLSQSVNNSINSFSIDLLLEVAKQSPASDNIAISPYTVWTLLAVVDEGASGNTARELESVLRIPNKAQKGAFRQQVAQVSKSLESAGSGTSFDISNAIFTTTQQKLIDEFANVAQKSYGVSVRPIDFKKANEASDTINRYVSQATRNRINNFIYPNDIYNAQIFITTALFFKGRWSAPFNRSRTSPQPFFDEQSKQIGQVAMMQQLYSFPYARQEHLGALSVELPYGDNGDMSMVVLLPYRRETIRSVLEKMSKTPFSLVLDLLQKSKIEFDGEDVELLLPRFTIKSDLNLNVILDKMGIKDVFNSQRAELLGIFPHYLYVSRLIQRGEIEVNEEGTVAASASGAPVLNKSPPPKFQANRPFLYFIVNKKVGSIVFAGKMSKPT